MIARPDPKSKKVKKDSSSSSHDKTIVRVSASFRIFGAIEDLAKITTTLGLQPTNTHKKGYQRSPKAQPYEHDMWNLTAPLDPLEPLEKHLLWLSERLLPHHDYIRKLSDTCVVDIFCGYTAESDESGFDLSPNALSVFSDLRIRMCVSIITI
jgi:hypothetical protein